MVVSPPPPPPFRWSSPLTPTQVHHLIAHEPNPNKALSILNSTFPSIPLHPSTLPHLLPRLASARLFPAFLNLLPLHPPPVPPRLLRPLPSSLSLHLLRQHPSLFDSHAYVSVLSSLVDDGFLRNAKELYDVMASEGMHRSLPVYNVMLKAFCKKERSLDHALKVFEEICERGFEPDEYTYGTLISGLCRFCRVEKAQEVFEEMERRNCKGSVAVYGALLHGLCGSGRVDDALRLFEEMWEKGVKPNVVVYSVLVDGLCKGGRSLEGLEWVGRMVKDRCAPNMITYCSLLNGLFAEGKVREGREVMDRMRLHGKKPDAGLYGKLVKGLFDEGMYEEAANYLDEMVLSGVKPHRLTWGVHIRMHNLVARGLVAGKNPNRAFHVYLSMRTRCISTEPETYHCLVDGFCNKGDLHKAVRIMNEMVADGCVPDQVTWNVVVEAFWDRRKVREATDLVFGQLKDAIVGLTLEDKSKDGVLSHS